ncbi:MAG: hypothetical protein E6Q97_14870 [Desulfurellales bacterium]|nr:MAG: hypothetical protein E6Q97_14870 [Desulfurellales bacterium]
MHPIINNGIIPSSMTPKPVDIVYLGEAYQASGTDGNFASFPLGTAAADRIIVLCVQCTNNTGTGFANTTVINVTLGGVTMTRIVEAGFGNRNGGIFILAVPAGTSATIITSRGTNATHKIAGWAVYNALSATPTDSNIAQMTTATSVNVNTLTGGGVIAMGCQQGITSRTYTFTGVNEDLDNDIAAGDFAAGHIDNIPKATPRTVTVTPSATVSGQGVAAAVSFR